ncbi:MAG: methyltransferase domain-containing protein [Proteobacteria bacterium]|nr:methyltransferase domain-containing protein [Pseudomonadota bacterium]
MLEIGRGPGDFLRGARMAGFTSIAGVEPGDGEAEYARSLGFEVHNQMFLDVEFTDARFDVIVSRQVIEHVLDPVRFLTAATAL